MKPELHILNRDQKTSSYNQNYKLTSKIIFSYMHYYHSSSVFVTPKTIFNFNDIANKVRNSNFETD